MIELTLTTTTSTSSEAPPLSQLTTPTNKAPYRRRCSSAIVRLHVTVATTAAMTKRKRSTFDVGELRDQLTKPLGDDFIPKYDLAREEMPESAMLSAGYKALQKGAKYLYDLLTEPLAKWRTGDWAPERFAESAQKCLVNYRSEQIMVSVRGNMGSGKSSLINSLYGVGELARTKSAGTIWKRVTMWPVPYVHLFPTVTNALR